MASYNPMKKNTAQRIVFPILDADGDPVTGATTPDTEYSLDGGSFSDCSDEVHEIATSSGVYYIDLLAAETNGDVVAIQCKTATAGAKTTVLVFYTTSTTLDAMQTELNKIGTITNTGGTATIGAVLGDMANSAIVTRFGNLQTEANKIGTIVNTGGTATIGAVLGDFANSALVTRVGAGAAQSATALSTANWTAARAGYLDNINNANLATVPAISAARIGYLDNINQAGLLQVTAARAGYLDNVNQSGLLQVTAARAGYLDNINNAGLATITPTTIWNLAVEGAITAKQATELMLAVLCGKTSEAVAGTMVIRDANDTVDRITATMDANRYRTGVVLNP
jgi:hypothetical protein